MNWSVETVPSYKWAFLLPGEDGFSAEKAKQWAEEKQTTVICICFIYAIGIFAIQHMMSNRKPFSLKRLLIAWNIGLATFSILAFIRVFPEFYYATFINGLHYSVCIPSFYTTPPTSFWSFAFVLSKVVELGDTIFVVLRNKPLMFVHWYHHISVLLYVYYSYLVYTPTARWFGNLNLFIHSAMYSYNAAKAIGYRIPTFFKVALTSAQIAQMVVGCLVNYWAYTYLKSSTCKITYLNISYSVFIYFTYLLLFIHFFFQTYIHTGGKSKSKSN